MQEHGVNTCWSSAQVRVEARVSVQAYRVSRFNVSRAFCDGEGGSLSPQSTEGSIIDSATSQMPLSNTYLCTVTGS